METMSSDDDFIDPLPPRKKIKTVNTSSNRTDGISPEVKMEKLSSSKTKVFIVSEWSEEVVANAVERLGGILSPHAQRGYSATHILAGKVSRSDKMLQWIAAGKWVLHPDYVTSSLAAGHWLPEENFEWGNPANNFLGHSSTDEVKVAHAAKKWRWCVANSGSEFTGAFSGIRAILHLPDEKKDLMKLLVKYGGGSVLDISPPFSVPSAASHIFSEQKFLQKSGKVDHVRLAARGIPVLETGFLIDMIMEPGPPKVEDYLLDDFKPFWMKKMASLSLAKINALRVPELKSRLADLGLPVNGYKPDLVQRLFQHQGTVGSVQRLFQKQGTVGNTDKEKQGTAGSTNKEKQGTVGSTDKEKQGTAGSTNKEKQGTVGSTNKEKQGTTGSTNKEKQGTVGSTNKEKQGTAGSTNKEKQGTAGSTNKEKSNKGRNSWLSGNKKVAMGEVEEAIKLYTKALDAIKNETCKNPSIVDVRTSRSEAFFLEKRYREALEDAFFVLERNPEDTKNLLRAIRCCLFLGDIEAGKRCISKTPHGKDQDQEIKTLTDKFKLLEELKERVSNHYEVKDFRIVLELVDEAIAISPMPYFITMKAKCSIYLKKTMDMDLHKGIITKDAIIFAQGLKSYCIGNLDSAILCFQKITKNIPEAIFWLDRANVMKRAQLTKGDLLEFSEGQFDGQLFNEATDFIPATLNNRAASRMIEGNYKGALDDIRTVLSIVPNQTEATIKYVQCNMALGNVKEATDMIKDIANPIIRNVYSEKLKKLEDQCILILDLMNQELYEKAVEHLNIVRLAYPDNVNLVLLQAECQAILVRIPQADRLLFQSKVSVENAHYCFVRGVCCYYKNKLSDAKRMFNAAVSIASKNQFKRVLTKATSFEQRTVAMIEIIEKAKKEKELGRKQKALDHFTFAFNMDKSNTEYVLKLHLYRAELYKDLQRYTSAIYDYEKAIEIKPNCSEAWTGKGNVQILIGNFKEAVNDFQKAYNISKTHENRANLNRAKKLFKNEGKQTHYDVLGISRNATEDEIKNAYYNKAKEYHPDKHMNAKEDERKKMEAMMKNVTAAQRCLSDPAQRRKYDGKLEREAREDYNTDNEDEDSEDDCYPYRREYWGFGCPSGWW